MPILQRTGLDWFFCIDPFAVLWVSRTLPELIYNLGLNNPTLYCFFCSLSLGFVPLWLSAKLSELKGADPCSPFLWYPLHVTHTSHQPALRAQAFCATVCPGPSPSLLDPSRSRATRLTGSVLGSDKPRLECRGQRALCALLSHGSVGDNRKASIFTSLSLFRGKDLVYSKDPKRQLENLFQKLENWSV